MWEWGTQKFGGINHGWCLDQIFIDKINKGLALKLHKQLYDPFLRVGFDYLKAAEPLQGQSLLLITKYPGVATIQLINLGRMKGHPWSYLIPNTTLISLYCKTVADNEKLFLLIIIVISIFLIFSHQLAE